MMPVSSTVRELTGWLSTQARAQASRRRSLVLMSSSSFNYSLAGCRLLGADSHRDRRWQPGCQPG